MTVGYRLLLYSAGVISGGCLTWRRGAGAWRPREYAGWRAASFRTSAAKQLATFYHINGNWARLAASLRRHRSTSATLNGG